MLWTARLVCSAGESGGLGGKSVLMNLPNWPDLFSRQSPWSSFQWSKLVVTRITVPTLMLNGLHDPLEPLESSQLPMYRLLGTPAEHKRHVRFDDWGHGLPTNERIRESLDFLDRYLGPVN